MISASPSIVTKVPLLLWSFSTHLSCRRSIVQCRREARWSATVSPQPDSRPSVTDSFSRRRTVSWPRYFRRSSPEVRTRGRKPSNAVRSPLANHNTSHSATPSALPFNWIE